MSLQEFAEYLIDRFKDKPPITHQVGDQQYRVKEDGTLGEPVRELPPQFDNPTLEVSTLSGLVNALAAGIDGFDPDRVALHIKDYCTVELISTRADYYGRRHVWIRAKHRAELPFKFGHYYATPELFLIDFRAAFLFDDESAKVEQLCSSLVAGDSISVADDGISQTVTLQTGTVVRARQVIPRGGITLQMFRTFRDASAVSANYLLRMKAARESLPTIALFEVDPMWELYTVQSVETYLADYTTGIRIIA